MGFVEWGLWGIFGFVLLRFVYVDNVRFLIIGFWECVFLFYVSCSINFFVFTFIWVLSRGWDGGFKGG